MRNDPFIVLVLKSAVLIFVSLTTITLFFVGLVVVLILLVGGIAASSGELSDISPLEYKTVSGVDSDEKLLSIRVSGMILGEKDEMPNPFDFFGSGVTYGYDVKQELIDAATDDSIKGVILEINSPGGTIYGSHAIADGVSYYKKKTNKPVIVFISGLGASGAYWAAVSADAIYADYGSTIGSIGVIFGPFQYFDKVVSQDGGVLVGGVVTQNGIDTTYFTAGKSKDIGNPYRQLTQEEIASMQASVNNEYVDFVSYVSTRRKISQQELKERIGAMIYENKRAQALRLIDGTKNKQGAYRELAGRAGIKGDSYKVVTIRREPTFVQMFLDSMTQKQTLSAKGCPSYLFSTMLVYFGDPAMICFK